MRKGSGAAARAAPAARRYARLPLDASARPWKKDGHAFGDQVPRHKM